MPFESFGPFFSFEPFGSFPVRTVRVVRSERVFGSGTPGVPLANDPNEKNGPNDPNVSNDPNVLLTVYMAQYLLLWKANIWMKCLTVRSI